MSTNTETKNAKSEAKLNAADAAIEVRASENVTDSHAAELSALRSNPTTLEKDAFDKLDAIKTQLSTKDQVLIEVARQTIQAGGLELLHEAADVEDANLPFKQINLSGTEFQYRDLADANVTPAQLKTELETTVKENIGKALAHASGAGKASRRSGFRFQNQQTEQDHSGTRGIDQFSDGARVSKSVRDCQVAGVDFDFQSYAEGRDS